MLVKQKTRPNTAEHRPAQPIKDIPEEKPAEDTLPLEKSAVPHTSPISADVPKNDTVDHVVAKESCDETGIHSNEDMVRREEPKRTPFFDPEQNIVAKLPVWIGGVAIALAGFFLVKYSIDNNLLSPTFRVVAGVILGAGLLYAAQKVRALPDMANGTRIGQSLAGAGIAVLYVSVYAAARLYGLIPDWLALFAMAGVTVTAVILSLRHGAPIALLGLVGGLLTPMLVSEGAPSFPLLCMYLYMVFAALITVIRHCGWWGLSLPALFGMFGWVILIISGYHHTVYSIWPGLLLIAMSITVVIASKDALKADDDRDKDEGLNTPEVLNYACCTLAVILTAVITARSGFGVLEWGMFAVLAIGGIGLAYFNPRTYGAVPWLSMATNLVMLLIWRVSPEYDGVYAFTLVLFAALYIGSGYWLMFRTPFALRWGALSAVSAVAFYAVAYLKLHDSGVGASIPVFWGAVAMMLAGACVYAVKEIWVLLDDHPSDDYMQAAFATAAAALISFGMIVEINREYIALAFAAQVLAISFIYTRVSMQALRLIAGASAVIFLFFMLPQIGLLIQLTSHSLTGESIGRYGGIPHMEWPVLRMMIPAALFLGAAYLFRKDNDDHLVRAFECVALSLVIVGGYYLSRRIMQVDEDVVFKKAGFAERGMMTNIIGLFGLVCFIIGRLYRRAVFSWFGVALCLGGVFRIVFFDLLIDNPLFNRKPVSGVAIFNILLLPFGLPVLWLYYAAKECVHIGLTLIQKWLYGVMPVLLFILITFNVRFIYTDGSMNHSSSSASEVYSYSAAWLVFGLVMLFFGVLKQHKMMRVGAFIMIALTVGKVFLYDASALEGLYRVFSFLGLGVCLIGLSWFYTRFVSEKDVHSG